MPGWTSVEQALRAAAESEAPFVTEAAQHVMVAGGKRFRPLLVLLAAEFGPAPAAADVVTAAVVVELTHLATLLPRRRDGRGRRCAGAPPPRTPAGTTRSRS